MQQRARRVTTAGLTAALLLAGSCATTTGVAGTGPAGTATTTESTSTSSTTTIGVPTTGEATSTTTTTSREATTAPGPAAPTGGDREGPWPVVAVVDGDTVKVNRAGRTETLRLIGMDTPETKDPRKPVQCFGREASARATELLAGTSVELELDPAAGTVDKYGRTLAYVRLPDGRLFEEVMIAEGFAHEYTYDLPYRYQDAFRAAEAEARTAQRGLWSPTTCAGDTDRPADAAGSPSTTVASPPAGATPTGCDPAYVGACVPPGPPDVDCADLTARNFRSVGTDPHHLDGDGDGIACEG